MPASPDAVVIMDLAERLVGDIVILSIGGTLTSSDVADLHHSMTALVERGVTRAVIDLAELKYLDSLGLGELVACQLRAVKANMTMRLANADARVQDMLLITRLITVFDAYDSLPAALESFDENTTTGF
jgi:anti-sigma B factor antagonist